MADDAPTLYGFEVTDLDTGETFLVVLEPLDIGD